MISRRLAFTPRGERLNGASTSDSLSDPNRARIQRRTGFWKDRRQTGKQSSALACSADVEVALKRGFRKLQWNCAQTAFSGVLFSW
jgi:hypothetical protein